MPDSGNPHSIIIQIHSFGLDKMRSFIFVLQAAVAFAASPFAVSFDSIFAGRTSFHLVSFLDFERGEEEKAPGI